MLEFIDKPGFLIVALLGILVFGAKRLPDSARALGRSMRILKAETKGLHDDGGPTPPATAQPAVVASTTPVLTPVTAVTETPQAV